MLRCVSVIRGRLMPLLPHDTFSGGSAEPRPSGSGRLPAAPLGSSLPPHGRGSLWQSRPTSHGLTCDKVPGHCYTGGVSHRSRCRATAASARVPHPCEARVGDGQVTRVAGSSTTGQSVPHPSPLAKDGALIPVPSRGEGRMVRPKYIPHVCQFPTSKKR